ncbi:DUF7837 family putative zinc-binding protein [Halalkalirubrum salinum]
MSQAATSLGTCPFCGTLVSPSEILIEYKVEGEHRLYAECSDCKEPVRPQ